MPTDTTEKGLEDLIVAAMPEAPDESEGMGEDGAEDEGADLDVEAVA